MQTSAHCCRVRVSVIEEHEEFANPLLLQVNDLKGWVTLLPEQVGEPINPLVPQSVLEKHLIGSFVQNELGVPALLQMSIVLESKSSQSEFV